MKSSQIRNIVTVAAMALLGQANAQEAVRPILTPKPGPSPVINGPRVYGARPGRPFLYRIPCTGTRPIRFSAEGLPPSLQLDPATGILSGESPRQPAEYRITFHAANPKGRIAAPSSWWWATPWRSPLPWGGTTGTRTMTASPIADARGGRHSRRLRDGGLGYQYVNIDDCWMVKPGSTDPELGGEPRDAAGDIRANRNFPDMKALTAYIHGKG